VSKIKKKERLIDLKETYFFCIDKSVRFVGDGPDRAYTQGKKRRSIHHLCISIKIKSHTCGDADGRSEKGHKLAAPILLWWKATKSRGGRCSSHRYDGDCLKGDVTYKD
jgi:hypothetical protein